MRKQHLTFLHDDMGVDEIRVHVAGAPHLRIVTRPRFKTSGLSGDEWRTSVMWQERLTTDEWRDFDGPYGSLEGGCAAIFPGVCSSHPTWHTFHCTGLEFLRKGHSMGMLNNDGKPQELLHALGHLPWAYMIFFEEHYSGPMPRGESDGPWKDLCSQPGCAKQAVSVYALKHRYSDEGVRRGAGLVGRRLVVQFCEQHLCRGDCGLQDADTNYDVLSGPGPEDAHTSDECVSPARVVVVEMPPRKKKKPRPT